MLHCPAGNKASATVQPFLLLHLDIFPDAVHTVEDAFRFFSAPETLEGYRTASGKASLCPQRVKFSAFTVGSGIFYGLVKLDLM
jgi:ubiquitin carboxyl-terminal hydrolase 10